MSQPKILDLKFNAKKRLNHKDFRLIIACDKTIIDINNYDSDKRIERF